MCHYLYDVYDVYNVYDEQGRPNLPWLAARKQIYYSRSI